jgi:hypothetical protein
MKNIEFESPIEQLAYPVIYTISIKHNLEFTYQKKVGFQSGCSMTQEEYFDQQGWKYDGRSKNYHWNDNYWDCELYRIDFTLESPKMKIAIELDGEQFHKNKNRDKQKDDYLKNHGYVVLRVSGKEIIKNKNKLRELILNIVYLKEIGFVIEPQPITIKPKNTPKHTLDYHMKDID